ncbi:MAG: cupin [Bacteroidetes bacterium GWF2_42_66]|nr:MAG: cupin [Bacteroidetes bacterium GWA2_42_15]OFY02696.1 MAG: cupin [Bacteroidetes bacterium GWE2_42_39]OFY43895.1 MAG: cupin [Bacteroidetes bacterium GWF2_42_66]HBL77266.1 cupin domain-containing protein [Prolixibacteraceae bacterium]HCR90643.1 cupin domain-containing protein [Prolixibacteraceae bacterium]
MEKKSKEILLEKEVDWEDVGGGVSRQIFGYDKTIMMVKVKFEQGAVGYKHQHPHVQTTFVAAGKFELSIGDETKIIETGDGFYVEPNKIHGVVCLEAGMLIDVFSPMREDFLKY